MATANDVLNVARSQIGYSRWDDPEPGTKYGRWYAGLVGDPYFGYSGVPYCAMGASWTFDQANATCAGFPGAYCPTMLNVAKSVGAVLNNKRDSKPGDVAYFNWDGGVVDHVGFVEINQGSYVQTIEFNTNNGQVLRRTRSWDSIEAVVRPNYDGNSSFPITPETPKPDTSKPTQGTIDEDGWWGPNTTRKLQRYLGTTQDGVVSGQNSSDMRNVNKGGLGYNTWSIGKGGSQMVKALQAKIGMSVMDQDGYFGPNTCRALQKYLGTASDGYVSGPSLVVRTLQKRLNSNNL